MNVLFDHQCFSNQDIGGISRYYYELISGINRKDNHRAILSILISNNNLLKKSDDFKYYNFLRKLNFRGKQRIIKIINKVYSIIKIKEDKFDIFHPTYYDSYFLRHLKKPFVITVYDMIHEKFPNLFPQKNNISKHKYEVLKKARKIIAISKNTKKDLISILRIPPNKIEVVYLASSIDPNNSEEFKPNYQYILYVGVRNTYKNFIFFLKAIKNIIKDNKDLFLVCVGNKFIKEEQKILKDLEISDKVINIQADDKKLAMLYKNALCFVYPSLYEGFGMPILEAFSCGCPVALSDIPVFKEIAYESALYFNPYDEISIKNSINELIKNKGLREDLIKKGFERVKYFSWKNTIEHTLKIYESIIY